VLIRGVEGVEGPGRLTKHFQIDSAFNSQLLTRAGGLWVEGHEIAVNPEEINATPRGSVSTIQGLSGVRCLGDSPLISEVFTD
jgi:DNA-3-methyladenine glycosylase